MSAIMFDGKSGRRPSAEARRYVYRVLAAALDEDLNDRQGWVFGGMDHDVDRRRAWKEAKKIIAELLRKGAR